MDLTGSGLPARPSTVLRGLLAVSIGLPLLGFAVIVATMAATGVDHPESALITATNANNELSAHTWWSITQLGLAAALALVLASTAPDARRRRGLLALGALVVLLSMDELMQGHEFVAEFLSSRIDSGALASWALWIVVAVPVFAVGVTVVALQLRGLERRVKRLLLLAAGLFVLSAAGLEAVSAFMEGLPGWVFEIEILLEEAGESVAASLAIYALLLQAAADRPSTPAAGEPAPAAGPVPVPVPVSSPTPVPVPAAAPEGRAGRHRSPENGPPSRSAFGAGVPDETPTESYARVPSPRHSADDDVRTTPIPVVTRAEVRG